MGISSYGTTRLFQYAQLAAIRRSWGLLLNSLPCCASAERLAQIQSRSTHALQAVVKVVLHPSSPLVYTACLDGVVRCWDARSGKHFNMALAIISVSSSLA